VNLPSRRPNVTREARVGGCKVFLSIGFQPDGSIAEVFVDVDQRSTDDTTRAWASCWSRMASLALQAGVPLADIVEHFRFADFPPNGMVQPPKPMHFARSIVDWVVAVLEAEEGGGA